MRAFDILNPNEALGGAKVLEASAGTGKTFAIEHLTVRLLLETPICLEEILAITYTRAAAREMKMRIRANIAKALSALRKSESPWGYLSCHLGSKEALRRLEEALASFDKAQVFTIHGFCQRMLSEFSLEARCLQPGEKEVAPLGASLRGDLLDFLEAQQTLSPEQMQELMKRREIPQLCKQLLQGAVPSPTIGDFEEDRRAVAEAIRSCPYRHADLAEEFALIETACKYTGFDKEEIAGQVRLLGELLSDPASLSALRSLQYERGSLFDFLVSENRKKKHETTPLPPLFGWCLRQLQPLLKESMERTRLLERLRFAWQRPFEKLLEARGLFSPDFLLERMKRALAYPDFVAKVRSRYKAAIVDEFQDTDALQWEIFSTLFGELSLFYLVGDPKQSIYRFRKADLYTYYKARASLGADAHCSLDTNYRSVPQLVGALNDLFGERHVTPWLWLPGENRTEPYRPVKAGLSSFWDPGDGKKSVQFFETEDLKEAAYAYIADQIIRLRPHLRSFGSFAILVQSNQQATLMQEYLQKRSLPCAAKSRAPLGASLAMQALEELIDVLFFPRDPNCIKQFLAGPLVGAPAIAIPDLPQLFLWKQTLERKGLAAFFQEFLAYRWEGSPSFYEKIAGRGVSFFRDFFQLLEQLLVQLPKSFEAIKRMFREMEEADPEEDALARRRSDAGEDAIQIVTMHASKGLEFDVVFALGVGAKTPASQEEPLEAEAEKLRQLYVALTRAKLRLYIPLVSELTTRSLGGEPPLQLLWKRSKLSTGDARAAVLKLMELNPDIGLDSAKEIEPLSWEEEKPPSLISPKPLLFPKKEGAIHSYSSLAHSSKVAPLAALGERKSVHTFPRGAESGTLFHKIFERFFTEGRKLEEIVQEEIRFSHLSEWEEIVLDTAQKTLSMPLLDGASLLEFERAKMRVETEFFFHASPHFLKGCIDLLFVWEGRTYLLDWKTNWLGESDASYSEESLCKAMDEHNYWMQASLYAEAVRRAWPEIPFGGMFFLFLRGVPRHGVLRFDPKPFQWPS